MTAGIRRVVFGEDGGGCGVEALIFDTGGGLEFGVLIDRSLDIGPLSWRGEAIGWRSPSGFRHPAGHDPHADEGRGFDRLFSGFLVTCGLEHIRQPACGHPLHGSLPFTPGTLTACGVADQTGTSTLFCEGEVVQHGFRLRRRIEAPIDGNSLAIFDAVENLTATSRRQASLYHFNIGRPALSDGTIVRQGMLPRLGPLMVSDAEASLDSASYPVGEAGAECTVEMPRLALKFEWNSNTLPHLQLWGDLTPGRCVLSVEPCTSERLPGGRGGEEPLLSAGGHRQYALSVSVVDSK